MEDVYVELRAVAEVPEAADAFSVEERRLLLDVEEKDDTGRRELMKQLDSLRRERWSRTLPERKSMAEALHQRDRRAFVILGDPGSGKTTLLHILALVYARGPEAAASPKLTACRSSSLWPPSTTCCARLPVSPSSTYCRTTTTAAAACPASDRSSAAPWTPAAPCCSSMGSTRCWIPRPAITSRSRPVP